MPNTERPRESGAAVRGPIDWPATVRRHAVGQTGTYVTRPRRRTFDTPEHRALQWALRALNEAVTLARMPSSDSAPDRSESVAKNVDAVRRALRFARRSEWLREIHAERPTAHTRQRLRRSRNPWVQAVLSPTVELLLRQGHADPARLTTVLRQRYFVPERDWLLYEVVVLIRLDRALCAANLDHVRRALFSESGVAAVYRLADGSEVRLRQQSWPTGGETSRRQATAKRHGLHVLPSRPDLIAERTSPTPDVVVLELKASRVAATLGGGLSQLLGYLHERPGLFATQPAGWLVPLPSEELVDVEADPRQPLWIVPADRVADAVVARFVPTSSGS